MKMPQPSKRASLWSEASAVGNLSNRFLCGAGATVCLGDLEHGSCLRGRVEELRGRSVLVATADQLTAALALIELDGIAGRVVLYPADLPIEHIPFIVTSVPIDAMVTDRADLADTANVECFVTASPRILPAECDRTPTHETEWILL